MDGKTTYEGLENRVEELKAELSRKEMELKGTATHYRSLIDKIQSAIVVHGADTKIRMCNPKALELLGIEQNEMLGRDAMNPEWKFLDIDGNIMRPEQYPVNQVLATRRPLIDLEVGIVQPNTNSIVWGLVSASPEFDNKGEILQVIVNFVDISEHKQTEKVLRQSEINLRATLDATPFPVAVVDLQDDKIFYWSRSAIELFGHTAPTASEWYEMAYPDPDYRSEVIRRWKPFLEKAKKTGKPVNTGVYQVTCKDGSERICELYATFLPNNLIVTFNDITARYQAEASLRAIEWQLTRPIKGDIMLPQPYGDLTALNTKRVILNTIGTEVLSGIVSGYLSLLETSAAVYESNGDYAHGIFSSGWCRMLDSASRKLCDTDDDAVALSSGKWHCHESCWTDASKVAIESGEPMDIPCNGGIRLYVVPIMANNETVGAINFGYGNPPEDIPTLKKIAKKYRLELSDLIQESNQYESRSPFIIEVAKSQLQSSAKLIGALVESRLSQDALVKEREQLNVTLRSIGDGVITTDTDGKVVLLNKSAEKLTRWTQAEAFGHGLEEVFHIVDENTRQPGVNPVQEALGDAGSVGLENNSVLIARDGTEIIVTDSSSPIVDSDGKTVGVVLVFRDNTEKVELEDKLRQAHKMEAIGTLAGGIAHEFNNVLGIIIGNTELAIDDLETWHPVRDNLSEIKTASLRAKDVVKQLLSFSRSDKTKRAPIDMRIIVKESLKLLRASIPSSTHIATDIHDDIQAVIADPTQIHQLLINLSNNAAHSLSEEGGSITIELKNVVVNEFDASKHPDLSPRAYVRLSVRDDGHGIPTQYLQKIFEPYFTTKDVGEGTGMGLAVVHGIVKTHDGAIVVDSKVGNGTSMHVYIPASQKSAFIRPPSDEVLPTGTEKILFVDDEDSISRLFVSVLNKLGYAVSSETNPVKALTLFKSDPGAFDLVITDMTMPYMTGDQLAESIIKLQPGIPIIICTGYSEKITQDKAQKLGVRALLSKPLVIKELAYAIRDVLENSQL